MLARKAVHEPADLAGLKIRTLPNPVITECLRLMGAAATPLAMGEIYTALQAGVLDGLEHDPPTIVASNANLTRMDAKLRDGFLAAAQAAAIDTRAHGLAVEQEALVVLQKNGVTIVDCDREAFRKRVAVQSENFMKSTPASKPIIEAIRATPV